MTEGFFDPIAELRKCGVSVRLATVSGGKVVQHIEDGRQRHVLERHAHEKWLAETLARYNRLIKLQLSTAESPGGYRSVQWLIAHGYLEVKDGKYVFAKR